MAAGSTHLGAPLLTGLSVRRPAGLEAGDVLAALLHLLLQRQVFAPVQRLELLLRICMVLTYLRPYIATQPPVMCLPSVQWWPKVLPVLAYSCGNAQARSTMTSETAFSLVVHMRNL